MGRPATVLTEVNRLVDTLALTPEAAALVAVARSLARRIDAADDANASGAVLSAVPGLTRQLGEQLERIVFLTASKEDPLLSWLNDETGKVSAPPDLPNLAWVEDADDPRNHHIEMVPA